MMKGINTPYVYVGAPFSSFGMHIEDGDLGSVNYNHEGEDKFWYAIPNSEGSKLVELVQSVTDSCNLYIRHKTVMIPPSVLELHNIKFARIIQKPGEYVILFPGTYHSGFNAGYNVAEAINFAASGWLEAFPKYEICNCKYSKGSKIVQRKLKYIYNRK